MAQAVVEGFGGLAGEGAAGGIGDGAGDHDRQSYIVLIEDLLAGDDSRLGVEGIENGLDQQQVHAALDQASRRLGIGLHQLVEGDVARAGVIDVR